MSRFAPIMLLLAVAARGPENRAGPEFEAVYQYSLSTNFGPLPFSGVGLAYDPQHKELYVTGDGPVRIFNDSGMEVYSFADAGEMGAVRSVAALDDGSLLVFGSRDGRSALLRCSFRGEIQAEIVPRNVPPALANVEWGVLRYAGRKFYLASLPEMRVLVLDDTGEYVASYDIAEKLKEEEKRAQLGIRGFNVDSDGNILFTIQPLFRAYVMSPDGEVRGFGTKGSAPGKFNVVGGIARDAAGNYYVVDILKSAVLVFDPQLEWIKEFGYRGRHPGSLSAPDEIVAAEGKVFVSNRGRRGVSVFKVGAK